MSSMSNHHAQFVSFEDSGHVEYICPGNHDGMCQFCDGGLFACSICGSFEGATTTHCPGERMSYALTDRVYNGETDYRNGDWRLIGSPHTPNRGWDLFLEAPSG